MNQMDPFQALSILPQLVADYQAAAAELAQVRRELAAQQDDKYVDWEWVCDYFGVTIKTARLMLKDEKLFVHGQQIKRFKRSQIIRFAERHTLKVKDLSL